MGKNCRCRNHIGRMMPSLLLMRTHNTSALYTRHALCLVLTVTFPFNHYENRTKEALSLLPFYRWWRMRFEVIQWCGQGLLADESQRWESDYGLHNFITCSLVCCILLYLRMGAKVRKRFSWRKSLYMPWLINIACILVVSAKLIVEKKRTI